LVAKATLDLDLVSLMLLGVKVFWERLIPTFIFSFKTLPLSLG